MRPCLVTGPQLGSLPLVAAICVVWFPLPTSHKDRCGHWSKEQRSPSVQARLGLPPLRPCPCPSCDHGPSTVNPSAVHICAGHPPGGISGGVHGSKDKCFTDCQMPPIFSRLAFPPAMRKQTASRGSLTCCQAFRVFQATGAIAICIFPL